MKVIKSLLLGSAAGIAAVAAAQAADLPSRKSAPAEYVKICDAYGAGFFYIPGTDTCLRVGGYLRAEYAYSQPKNSISIPSWKANAAFITLVPTGAASSASYIPSGVMDSTGFLGRGRVELDARTQTAWGTARTFIALRGNAVSGVYNQNYQTASTVTGGASATALTVEQAIVQFSGFTFGRTTAEIFSFLPAYNYASFSNSGFPGAINILSYTATFGGGFSATLGIEDRGGLSGYSTTPGIAIGRNLANATTLLGLVSATAASATPGIANGPYTWPALVGNVRFDQSWGAIQIMGSVVQNGAITALTNTNPAAGGSSNVVLTQTGWSLGAGLKLNLPQLAAGDHLYLTAAYGVGDLDHVLGNNTSGSPPNIGRELGGLWRQDRNMYVGASAVACAAGTITRACFRSEETTAWSIAGWFTHYWTPTIRSVLLSSYAQITPGTMTRNTDWTLGGLSNANLFKIAGQLVWTPVKDLDIGAEVQYLNLQQKLAGTNGAPPTAIPAGWGGTGASSNTWQARLRVQRQF